MTVQDLPTLNATLNLISAFFLAFGYFFIKQGREGAHKKMMIAALISSALFLISYLIYHYAVGSVPYQKQDWTRPVYFIILIPHVILAAAMVPFHPDGSLACLARGISEACTDHPMALAGLDVCLGERGSRLLDVVSILVNNGSLNGNLDKKVAV